MSQFDKIQKIIIIAFILITIVTLWAISPMGKMYLPMDITRLEEDLNFKVPEGYSLKATAKLDGNTAYHLYNEKYSPTVITLIGFDEPIKEEVITNIPANKSLLKFWQKTYLQDPKFSNCGHKIILKNKFVFSCNLEADKIEMSHKNPREGEIALIVKDNKYIFLAATASKMAYSPVITRKLLSAILKSDE